MGSQNKGHHNWAITPDSSAEYPVTVSTTHLVAEGAPNREGSSTCSCYYTLHFIKLNHQCLEELEAVLSQRIWTQNLAAKARKSCRQHSKTGSFHQLETQVSFTLKSSKVSWCWPSAIRSFITKVQFPTWQRSALTHPFLKLSRELLVWEAKDHPFEAFFCMAFWKWYNKACAMVLTAAEWLQVTPGKDTVSVAWLVLQKPRESLKR